MSVNLQSKLQTPVAVMYSELKQNMKTLTNATIIRLYINKRVTLYLRLPAKQLGTIFRHDVLFLILATES